jgi:hypothetical protein
MLWFEVVAITVLALYAAARLSPGNPLLVEEFFPWVWLAPTLLALRYGSIAAMGSAAIVLSGWMLSYLSKAATAIFPTEYFLGGLILTLGAGQFSDIWHGRLRRVREVNSYLDQRLEALTRQHHVLKLSYDRLEQDLLTRPVTLRNSLSDLRRLTMREEGPKAVPMRGAQELMRILAQTSQLEKASLHVEVNGRIDIKPVASMGGVTGLNLRDPLITLALSRNELCHVQTATLRDAKSNYLVAAPVIDAAGNRLGLLVVERMPFLCLNKEALQVLSVTLGYYADMINVDPRTFDLCRKLPGCPSPFAEELLRLERIYQQCSISSTLVAMDFNLGEKQKKLAFAETERQCRRLDVSWPIRTGEHNILVTILPLYGQAAAEGYIKRIEERLSRVLGKKDLSESGIRPFIASIGAQPANDVLTDILEKCHAR